MSSEDLGLHVFFWKNNRISGSIQLIFLPKTVKTEKKYRSKAHPRFIQSCRGRYSTLEE